MRSPNGIVFLFDVDNTLLDNDRVQDDLTNHLERGSEPRAGIGTGHNLKSCSPPGFSSPYTFIHSFKP